MFDFYSMFPEIVRRIDESSGSPVLSMVSSAFLNDLSISQGEISGLRNLKDTQQVPLRFLHLLGKYVGENPFSSWSEDKKRLFVSSLVFLYHVRGMKSGVDGTLNSLGFDDVSFVEMWKSTFEEIFDYSESEDYTHTIKAARVKFFQGGIPARISDILTEEQLKFLKKAFPIHVLEVPDGETQSNTSSLGEPLDDMYGTCRGTLPELLEIGDVDTEVITYPDPKPSLPDGGLVVYVSPVCQTVCQADCEAAGCETVGCMLRCEGICQSRCEFICQLHCQSSCESPCMVTIQG